MGGSYSKPKEIASKLWATYKEKLPSQAGKVILITGCTTGTGFNAARLCGGKGAEVVMLNRKSARADAALQALKTEVPSGKFVLIECDLMSLASVRAAAAAVKAKYPAIDVLACNAGVMALPDAATEDGFDTQMQTNHLAHWLLAAELWPCLEKAADKAGEARIVTHSSLARYHPSKTVDPKYYEKTGGKLGGDGDGWFSDGPRWQRYNQSKMANAVMAFALADKLSAKGSKIKAVSAAPGLAATNLQVTTNNTGGMGTYTTNILMSILGQSGEDGALPLIMCMISPEVKQGEFWEPSSGGGCYGVPKAQKRGAIDTKFNKDTLWQKSVEATGVDIKI